jgi:hypothetical protein
MPKKTERRVAVTERALLQRINRKFLADEGAPAHEMKKTRGARAKIELGDFYVLNTERNFIDAHHVDPEATAREMKVMEEWEYLAEGKS